LLTRYIISTFILVFSMSALSVLAQDVPAPAPVYPVPTAQQLEWHEMETNAFVHFTTNTFTDLEWGYGDESETIFNPTALDVNQWANILKETGFKTLILTTKHHDGFTLWPSKYTEHSIKNSPYKNGKGDLVKETADAARNYGLKFGVYLSPWDRNHPEYGRPAYLDYYRNQLKELLTNYRPIFEMWFDGANGGAGYYGGARETRKINSATYYDWPKTLEIVRKIQPNVLFFSDVGPGVRWAGNERGLAGVTNWNTISTDTLYGGKPGISAILNSGSPDGEKWIPAEVDVSIRPGWFYHAKEDEKVKTAGQLFEIYLSSVGRGSTLLLNIPPDRRGLFHEKDVESLRGFKKLLDTEFARNLANGAKVTATSVRGDSKRFAGLNVTDENKETYWATDDDKIKESIEIDLKREVPVKYIVLQEYIKLGQRVKSFSADVWKDGSWTTVAEGSTIGYKRILRIDPVATSRIRLRIGDAKASPLISNVEIY
jgi:alpha-L-fucosidase